MSDWFKSEKEEKLVIIDADHALYIACHNKEGEPEKNSVDCIKAVDSYLTDILNKVGATSYIGALTVGKCFRYEIYPDYKANRKYTDPMKYLQQVKEYLLFDDKWKFVHHHGLEADDIIGICATKYPDATIISPDKDLMQIPGKHFNPRVGEYAKVSEQEAAFMMWKQTITGDSSDNIKGVAGLGPKKAESLFEEHAGMGYCYISLSAYIARYGEHIGIEEFYKNYSLVRLKREECLGFITPEPKEFKG